jgi:hypothetical protein
VFSVFSSRCLVAATNGRLSSSSGFPNCSRPLLPAVHFSQLQLSTDTTTLTAKLLLVLASILILGYESHGTHDLILLSDGPGRPQTVVVIKPRHGPHGNRVFHHRVFSRCRGNNVFTEPFPRNDCRSVVCTRTLLLLGSGSKCHGIKQENVKLHACVTPALDGGHGSPGKETPLGIVCIREAANVLLN